MAETVKDEEARTAGTPQQTEDVQKSDSDQNSESGKTETPPQSVKVDGEKQEGEKTETEKACGGKKDDEDKKKACGTTDEEDEEEQKKKAASVKKSEGENSSDSSNSAQQQSSAEKTPVQTEDELQKSKRITPARTESLKKAALELLKLIGEIDSEAIKSIVGSFTSSNVAKQEQEKSMDAKTEKVEKNPEVEKLETELNETKAKLEETTKRLDEIEKSRQPSKSVEAAGGTDKVDTKKSFWTGVL